MTLKGSLEGVLPWPPTAPECEIHWAMRTDVGRRREMNEDSAVAVPPLFAVADGMGGHEAGEVASACVVERLSELGEREVTETELTAALRGAVTDLEDAGVDSGSGTTVSGVALRSSTSAATVFNIGDSRVYLYREGVLAQLTRDHSVVQDLVDAGHIQAEEAEFHPHANVITRAVGFHDDPLPDTLELELAPGDRLLLCSDGLTKELTDLGLAHFLATAGQPTETAEALIAAALENGGRDNITLLVLDVLGLD